MFHCQPKNKKLYTSPHKIQPLYPEFDCFYDMMWLVRSGTLNDLNQILNDLFAMKDEGTFKRLSKQPKPFQYIGIKMGDLRQYASKLPKNNALAMALFDLNYYESMLLATMIVDPKTYDQSRLLDWCLKAHSSPIIDQGISNFFFELKDYSISLKDLSKSTDEHLAYACFALLSSYFRTAPLNEIDISLSILLLNRIRETIQTQPLTIQNAMNNAVVMAGLHVPDLVSLSIEVADHIGYVMPLVDRNSCNIQSASDYLIRYGDNPKYSRVAKLKQSE